MKTRNIILTLGAMLSFVACQETIETVDSATNSIVFSISAGSDEKTRTVYSGERFGGKERIDWIAGEDEVLICLYTKENESIPKTIQKYLIVNEQPSEEKSFGGIAPAPGNSNLEWSTTSGIQHYFFSVYPGTLSNNIFPEVKDSWLLDNNQFKLSFNIPSNQYGDVAENMKYYAYMAAAGTKPYTYESTKKPQDKVELHFHPMVTTLYFTITNDTETTTTIEGIKVYSIKKNSWEPLEPLAGSYSASLELNSPDGRRFITQDTDNVYNTQGSPEITLMCGQDVVLDKGESVEFVCFIRPRTYDSSYLGLSIVTKDGELPFTLSGDRSIQPCYKYDVNVNLSGAGEIEPPIDPDGPSIVDISDAGAQLLLSLIRSLNQGAYSRYEDFFKNVLKFDDINAFNSWYNKNFVGDSGFDDRMEQIKKSRDVRGVKDWLLEIFGSADNVNEFLKVLLMEEEINFATNTPGIIAEKLTAEDLQIFKNVKKMTLWSDFGGTFEIKGLNRLKTLIFDNASHGVVTINISECASLQSVDVSGTNAEFHVTIDQCPKLSEVLRGPNVVTYKVTNCNADMNTE